MSNEDIQWQDTSWREVLSTDKEEGVDYNFGGSTYYKLYNNIKLTDFIPVIDKVIQKNASIV